MPGTGTAGVSNCSYPAAQSLRIDMRTLARSGAVKAVQGAIPPKSSARRVVVRHEAPRRLMAPDRRPAGLPRPQRA